MTENKSQIDIIDPIIENNLEGYEPDECEYAPKKISKIEGLIYWWIFANYGPFLAKMPIIDIRKLSEYLHLCLFDEIEFHIPVVYKKEKEN